MALVEEKKNEEVTQATEAEERITEEDCSPEFVPIVQLQEVKTVKGDEDESIVWENKCKLYRFDADVWKERGLGQAKILKHKTNLKQRFVMHEDKTLKLRSNHFILPDTKLQVHGGNEKALVFSTIDFSDEKAKQESFCIRFGTAEKAQEFRQIYEAAIKENAEHFNSAGKKEAENSEVEELGEELEKKAVVKEKVLDEEIPIAGQQQQQQQQEARDCEKKEKEQVSATKE